MLYRTLRIRVAQVLTAEDPNEHVTRIVNFGILLLIVSNVASLVLETVGHIHAMSPQAFVMFETVSIYIFTVEYLLRIWSCTVSEHYAGPIKGRLRYIKSPMAVVDLLTVVPFFLPTLGLDLRAARLLRLFTALRMAKLARYSRTLQLFGRILSRKKEELITVLAFLALMVVMSSSLLYYAEHQSQPEVFSSIPATMWWAVATLTTVGYGDMYPVTVLGRLLGGVIAVLGIGMFILPSSILGSAFIEEVQTKYIKPRQTQQDKVKQDEYPDW